MADPNPDPRAASFLQSFPEDLKLNQYWYSKATILTLADEVAAHSVQGCAFLSTPSIYFAIPAEIRARSKLFEYDRVWETDPGFVAYDYNRPLQVPEELHHKFDMVVIDAPSITLEVVQQYLRTARLLLVDHAAVPDHPDKLTDDLWMLQSPQEEDGEEAREGDDQNSSEASFPAWLQDQSRELWMERHDPKTLKMRGNNERGKVLITTIAEHDWLLDQYFHHRSGKAISDGQEEDGPLEGVGLVRQWFRPSIPSLMYQYSIFVNYWSPRLAQQYNPEIDDILCTCKKDHTLCHCLPREPPPADSRKRLPAYLRQ